MSRSIRTAAAALLAVALAACPKSDEKRRSTLHVPSPDWSDQVIYFVMTDRFANGDPSNDDQGAGEFDPADAGKYSGGDLQGIIDRLDYIQGLGATAVWLTPPVANMWWDPLQQFGGYHGYWARHLERVDEHLGTLDTYRALSSALHARGMYLVQDVVPNHMGNFFTYSSYDPADPAAGFVANTGAKPSGRPEQAPFDQNDATDPVQRAAAIYHWTPQLVDYNDPVQEKTWQISDLDDLNTENPAVREALRRSYGFWVREVGVDAFRVDTAKFAPAEFWRDFFHSTDPAAPGILEVARATGRSDFLAFGEVFETSDPLDDAGERKIASFLGTAAEPALPGALQFPLYEEIGRVFAGGRPTQHLAYRLDRFMDPALFRNPYTTPTFVDNHDVRRFLSIGTQRALAQALAFVFTIPGIPVVYQGTEQYYGETRQAMFKGGWAPGAPLGADQFDTVGSGYQRLKALAALRRSDALFTRGTLEVLYDNPAAPGVLAYARRLAGRTALVLMNTADKPSLVAGLATGLAPGAKLEVLYSENLGAAPAAPAIGAGGRVLLELPARAILVARATGATETPPTPGASITVTTAIEGQTFAQDVVVSGTVTPAATELRLVIDDAVGAALPVTVAGDGSFTATLPVSQFPDGLADHTVTVYAPAAKAASPRLSFRSDVVFEGVTVEVADPAGDDTGPEGRYTYPLDGTFGAHMDVTAVKAEVGVTQLRLGISLADWSSVWNPPNGWDHVCFNVYFDVPGRAGLTFLPRLHAAAPADFDWSLQHFAFGWSNVVYTAAGAAADRYGAPAAAVPSIRTDPATRTVTFSFNRNDYGIEDWTGVKVYVATWDFDGVDNVFRPLYAEATQWRMGGGQEDCFLPDGVTQRPAGCADPLVMDDVAPITLP